MDKKDWFDYGSALAMVVMTVLAFVAAYCGWV